MNIKGQATDLSLPDGCGLDGGLDGWGVSTREGTNANIGMQIESKMLMTKRERAHEARKGNCT